MHNEEVYSIELIYTPVVNRLHLQKKKWFLNESLKKSQI